MPKSGMRSNMITKISISICIPYDITSMQSVKHDKNEPISGTESGTKRSDR